MHAKYNTSVKTVNDGDCVVGEIVNGHHRYTGNKLGQHQLFICHPYVAISDSPNIEKYKICSQCPRDSHVALRYTYEISTCICDRLDIYLYART